MKGWERMLAAVIVVAVAIAWFASWQSQSGPADIVEAPDNSEFWAEPAELTCLQAFPKSERLQHECMVGSLPAGDGPGGRDDRGTR